jgi:hypothetical protein
MVGDCSIEPLIINHRPLTTQGISRHWTASGVLLAVNPASSCAPDAPGTGCTEKE